MKYGNKKCSLDGIKFDSKLEAAYYLSLLTMKEDGVVKDFIIHPRFIVCDEYMRGNKKIAPVYAELDFQVFYTNGDIEYVDIKGMETNISKLKRKLLESRYPDIRVKWLERNYEYGNDYGWIEKEELKKIIKENMKKNRGKL